ncbi:Uncharacterised protein [Vibrio cholerae]|nr:Uncharacterised protein [Vibrio cholerae]
MAALSFIHIVRGNQNRGALRGKVKQLLPKLTAVLRINRRRGLIKKQ